MRLAGDRRRRHLIFAYVACGLFAAIAGVLLASRLGIAQPSVGVGYELDAIAAVVIGGGVLGGGGGTALGVLGGVLALASSTTCSTSSTSTATTSRWSRA